MTSGVTSVSLRSSGSTATPSRRSSNSWRASSISAAWSSSRATSTTRSRSPSCRASRRRWRTEMPLWVSVDQEGGRVARLKRPFTEWPPMATLGRSGDEALAERFARALGGRARGGRDLARLHAGARHPHQSEEPGDRRSRAGRTGRGRRPARRGDHPDAAGAKGSPPAASTFPGTATPASTRISSCRSSNIRRTASRPWSWCRSKRRSPPTSPAIMTAHILIPALDEERPATLSPAIVDGCCRRSSGFDGVVLTDDMEMKAISGRYGLGEATRAGDRRRLRRRADVRARSRTTQMAAIEAVIYAVEEGRISQKRIEDALGAPAPGEGALPRAAAFASGHRRGAARDARARRAPGDRRRDGALRLTLWVLRASDGTRRTTDAPSTLHQAHSARST